MPLVDEKAISDGRPILAPTGNRVRVVEEQRRKGGGAVGRVERPRRVITQPAVKPAAVVRGEVHYGVSADSCSDSSSSSSSGGLVVKKSRNERPGENAVKVGNGGNAPAKIAHDGIGSGGFSGSVPLPVKRCDWITPNSEPLYSSFHDEEWGVPVHDDTKLFELLVFFQALAELSWPAILSKRAIFRKLFYDFNPSSLANLDEERLVYIRAHGNALLSEPKLRAVVENAKQLLKIQKDLGSFSTYCWRFVNHNPIKGSFRHARQVLTKTPKSELMSKDLMRRGFHCVGPTVVYSFMQATGMVNNHLLTCFRHKQVGDDFRNESNDPCFVFFLVWYSEHTNLFLEA